MIQVHLYPRHWPQYQPMRQWQWCWYLKGHQWLQETSINAYKAMKKALLTDLTKEHWTWYIQKGMAFFGKLGQDLVWILMKNTPEIKKRRNPKGLTCCVAGMGKLKGNGCVEWGTVQGWSSRAPLQEGVRWRMGFACRHGWTWTPAEGVGGWSLGQRKKHRPLWTDWAKGNVSTNWTLETPGYLEIRLWNRERISHNYITVN